MKRILQTLINKQNIHYSPYTLKSFFKRQFKFLNTNRAIDLVLFRNYFNNLPYIIIDKIFKAFTPNDFLSEIQFILGMTTLYSENYLERFKLLFTIIDYDRDDMISKDDVKMFLLHFHLIGSEGDVKPLFKMVDVLFKDDTGNGKCKSMMSYNEVLSACKSHTSDIFILLLFFFDIHVPIEYESINVYESIIGKSYKEIKGNLIRSKEVNGDNNNGDDDSNYISFIEPSLSLYQYIKDNYCIDITSKDSLYRSMNDNDDDNELEDLNTFEEDIRSTISSFDLDTIQPSTKESSPSLPIKSKLMFINNSSNESDIKRKESVKSEGILHKDKLPLFIERSLKRDSFIQITPFENKSHISNAYLNCDSCKYIDKYGKCHQDVKILITKDIIFIYKPKSASMFQGKIDQYSIIQTLLLKKIFITTEEEEEGQQQKEMTENKDDYVLNIISTIQGIIEKYYLAFKDKSLLEKCKSTINQITNWRDINSEFEFKEILGSGTSGLVKLVQRKKTKENYALKIIPIYYSNNTDKADITFVNEEIDMSRLLKRISNSKNTHCNCINNSKHIVKVYDYYETPFYSYILMEYIEGFSLNTFLKYKSNPIQDSQSLVVTQLINSLLLLNYYGIIHRDIKPDNIMIHCKQNEVTLKLIDFGFAKAICPGETVQQSLGTILYASPDILLCKHYDNSVDLWSLGVILYQMLYNGNYPIFGEEAQLETIVKRLMEEDNITWEDEEKLNPENLAIQAIAKKCLERDEREKGSIKKIKDIWRKSQLQL